MSAFHLGINLGHDRSAAIVKDGEIVVAIQQERLDRYKHSIGFLHQSTGDPQQLQLPWESINYCLDHCHIKLEDLATITANMPGQDYAQEILKKNFGASLASKIKKIPSHHLAHAYTAYMPSGFEKAVVIVADASGAGIQENNRTESYSLYRGGR